SSPSSAASAYRTAAAASLTPQILKSIGERVSISIAITRIFFQAAQDDSLKSRRDTGIVGAGRLGKILNMAHCYRHRRISVEWSTSGEHLIHHDAKRIDVRGWGDNLALCLLRGIILYGAEGHAGCGEAFGFGIFIHAGDTKISELDQSMVV